MSFLELKVKRSRAYPSIALREAVEILPLAARACRRQARDRGFLARALGYSGGLSGVAARKIAALCHFGFLECRNSLYYPTALAQHISEQVPRASGPHPLLVRAFFEVDLFRDIVDFYGADEHLPHEFERRLDELGISDSARAEVGRIFVSSAEYAGILAPDGRFLQAIRRQKPESSAVTPAADLATFSVGVPAQLPDTQSFRLSLTGSKFAELTCSWELSEDDLALIRKQLEVLELQIKIKRPAPPLPWRKPEAKPGS